MGVKISDIVIKNEIELEELANKKIAIDFSNMIYQFLTTIRQEDGTPLMDKKGRVTSHLVGIFSRISNLMTKNIKICFVFDGKPPEEKHGELERRKEVKIEAMKKYEEASEEKNIENMYKYSRQTVRVTDEMFKQSKELLQLMGLPVVQAPSEGEAQAAFMCEKGDVDFVASQDFDSLIFGSPVLLQNLTITQKKKTGMVYPQYIKLDETLNSLGIDHEQLIVLAILVGTDFNPSGVKGIGPKNALKLVKQYGKNFDLLFSNVHADFDWKKIYKIFKEPNIDKKYELKWQDLDEQKVKEFLMDFDFSEERIESTFSKLRTVPKGQKSLNKWF